MTLEIDDSVPVDATGQVDTSPDAILNYAQRSLLKMAQNNNNNKEKAMLLRDLTANALTTRKLNIEESTQGNRQAAVEAFHELLKLAGGQRLEGTTPVTQGRDPYKTLEPPPVACHPAELSQGEHLPNPEDFLP